VCVLCVGCVVVLCSVCATIVLRLRTFVQMEDELQCLQHSRDWLGERGSQLALRDSELAGDALREVALVEAAWKSVRTLITDGYAAC